MLKLIVAGKRNKEIAFEMGLTLGTVKEYLYHLYRKIGVSNRAEAATWAKCALFCPREDPPPSA